MIENISAAVILDAVLLIAFILALCTGLRRGLIKSIWKVGALVITIILVLVFKAPLTNILAETKAAETVYTAVSEKIEPIFNSSDTISGNAQGIQDTLHMPRLAVLEILNTYDASNVSSTVDNISRTVTMMILGFAAAIILFIIIKLLLWIVYHILSSVSKLPVLNEANKLLGGVIGVVNMLFIVYIICAVVAFSAADNENVYRMINETYIVKYFYNYNILLQLFLKA